MQRDMFLLKVYFFKKIFIYLFILGLQLHHPGSLAVACGI